jgi:hypothetical protein
MSRNNLNLGIQFQFFIVIQLQVVTFLFPADGRIDKNRPGGLKSIKPRDDGNIFTIKGLKEEERADRCVS